jgi:hypothetical protein
MIEALKEIVVKIEIIKQGIKYSLFILVKIRLPKKSRNKEKAIR